MMRETVAMLLKRRGFRVVVASDGRAGLSAAERTQPDIALTDILMPELDGIGFIMALRRAQPAIKIIAMSGGGRMGNSDYLSIAAKLGADATLAKPFSGDDLVAVLSEVRKKPSPPSRLQSPERIVDHWGAIDGRSAQERRAEYFARKTAGLLHELDTIETRLNYLEDAIRTPLTSSRDV